MQRVSYLRSLIVESWVLILRRCSFHMFRQSVAFGAAPQNGNFTFILRNYAPVCFDFEISRTSGSLTNQSM